MTNHKPPILFAVDATDPASAGLGKALALARHTASPLDLLLVDYDPTAASAEHIKQRMLEADEQAMASITGRAREAGIDVRGTIEWSRLAEDAIAAAAADRKPWLVMKDAHRHSLLERTLFANTDSNLLRQCDTPLYFARPRRTAAEPTWLAAVDPCRDDAETLNEDIVLMATEMAEATGGNVAAVHVYQPPTAATYPASIAGPTGPMGGTASLMGAVNELREIHVSAFEALLDRSDIPAKHGHFFEGPVEEGLAAVADDIAADVIVTGFIEPGPIEGVLTGTTAERLIASGDCDLLVLKKAA